MADNSDINECWHQESSSNASCNTEDNKVPKNQSFFMSESLYLIAFALIFSFYGEFQVLSERSFSFTAFMKAFIGTVVIWLTNADIAAGLKLVFTDKESNQPLSIFKYNYIAVVLAGLCMVVSCFNPSEDSIMGLAFLLLTVIAALSWSVTQILVAFKLMANGGGLVGTCILAAVAIGIVGAVVLIDLSPKHNEATFLTMYGIEFIINMAMYISYKKYFNSLTKTKL